MQWCYNSDMPIYTQLVYQIKFGIVSGELKPGEKMIPVRELAAEAGVNPNTMQRALQQLEREGLVYSQRSSGRFVTDDETTIAKAKEALALSYIRQFTDSMKSLGYTGEEIVALLRSSDREAE